MPQMCRSFGMLIYVYHGEKDVLQFCQNQVIVRGIAFGNGIVHASKGQPIKTAYLLPDHR